jgi:hypothetical protein
MLWPHIMFPRYSCLLLLAACGSPPGPLAAPDPCETRATFDLGCDFSFASNPNGVWQYGNSDSPGGPLHLATFADTKDPVGLWHPDSRTYYPYVAWNGTPLARVDATDSWAVRPHQVAMEAAPSGQFSVVQFTAPQAGTYALQVTFEGIHFHHSTTDVHVLRGAVSLFDAQIDGYGGFPGYHPIEGPAPSAAFTGSLALAAGETLSFAVGIGQNHSNSNDTTGLVVQINR